ncbi:MAG: hydroxyacid dehydrogenase [Opitutaceae bacterium]|nr:hydroxyacid dehydrogenase [Opitutaceae bacterium]
MIQEGETLRLLIVLSEEEKRRFFSEGNLDDTLALPGYEIHWNDPSGADWNSVISEVKPQVVLGAWQMPSLFSEAMASRGGSVRYFCYVAGSTREKVNKEMLEEGLVVTNWGQLIGPYVAECALMLILCSLRDMQVFATNLKERGEWRQKVLANQSLYGKRVGFHGFGAIARALCRLLQPFNIIGSAYDVGDMPQSIFDEHGVRRCETEDDLFSSSDVLVELQGLTEETEKSVDERLLRLLPYGASFVNLGRGKLVDEKALIQVAKEGKIKVALDVYETEPLPIDSPLRSLPNATLLPHMGGATIDRDRACGALALRNLVRFQKGEPLENIVSLEQYIRAT